MTALAKPVLRMLMVCMLATPLTTEAADKKNPKTKSEKAEQRASVDRLFSSKEVPKIQIEIAEQELAKLRRQGPAMARENDSETASATVRDGQITLTNVAIKLKGAAGSFRQVDDKPAFTLNFDKHIPGQTFRGLEKLSLNNSVQDPTYLSEQFSRELFLKAGVPTPRATHAQVSLNGRFLGLYVLVEGWNKQFLSNHFKNNDGNLYDGGFLKDVHDEIRINSGDNRTDSSGRKALAEAVKISDPKERLSRLNALVDVDRFLSFVAMDIMLWDWDGYAMNRNNWRLYHDPDSGKMVFMPHGLDQLFWNPEGPLLPRIQGSVAHAILTDTALREQYFAKVAEFRKTIFEPIALAERLKSIAAKIRPAIHEESPEAAAEHDRQLAEYIKIVEQRCKSIDRQIANPATPLVFGSEGIAKLSKWDAKEVFGKPLIDKQSLEGTETLHLGVRSGSSIGSWKTEVWLEPGNYKLEGRVKTSSIQRDPGDSRPGTGLKAIMERSKWHATELKEWQDLECTFSVDGLLSQVQLSCEFRGAAGEAWYDLASLRLRKLPGLPERRRGRPGR